LTKDESICLYKLVIIFRQYSCNFIRVFPVGKVIHIFNFKNSQGTPSAIRPSPEVLHHQIGHLPIVLARYSKWSIQVCFVGFIVCLVAITFHYFFMPETHYLLHSQHF
jgi:hypothetical protein